MTRVLRVALARATTTSEAVEIVSARELASAPGRRAVVLYVVHGLEEDQPVPLVGKTFIDPCRAGLLQGHLRRLHDGPFGAGGLRVPEPVAFLPSQRLVLYRHCPGTPLDRVSEAAQLDDGVRRAARWLGRLHTSDVRLPRAFSLEQEEESTRRWARLIGDAHPHLASPALALAERWAQVARSIGPSHAVPIHKDFHPGHVLVGKDLYVVDLDEARQGDPAFDLAHFCAYLELPDDGRARWAHAFLAEYASATGWLDKGSYAPFCAYAWLKIAKQWTVGSALFRDAGADERLAGAARALAKGRECLSE